jgi:phosphonate transport system ATP-binding protein
MNLSIENVTVIYEKDPVPAVQDVSLTFRHGEFVGILGSSGAGKSTLIRCINMLVRPTSGHIVWDGKNLTNLPESELRYWRTHMGMVFQQFHLVPRLNVLANVLTGTLGIRSAWKNWAGYFSREEREAALSALEQVGLSHLAKQRVEKLSGGQQQRVAIARMMLQDPQIILGDEPVASLDPVTARTIMDIIIDIHRRKQLITVMNLHDVELAKQYATRIIGLSHGKVVFDGSPDEVTPDVQARIYS